MRYLFYILLSCLGFTHISYAQALTIEWQENSAVKQVIKEAGVEGTFVLYDAYQFVFVGHNQVRAQKRFVPASTYKVPHTLIGLSEKAVANVDEVLPYGGKEQPLKIWEKDMSLREAIKISNIPIYQELARRIGLERMRLNLAKLEYGNAETGAEVDTFWLRGPLKISAQEQTIFLTKLALGLLPYPRELQEQTCEIVFLEQGAGWQLFGKTGTAKQFPVDIGWWVGWVETPQGIYAFALNIDMPSASDAPKRVEIGKACLKALGIL